MGFGETGFSEMGGHRYLGPLYNASPNIWGPSPKNFLPFVKFGSILHSFRLWSRVSPEWVKIYKIGKTWLRTIPPAFGEISQVNFGPLSIK